MNSSILSVRNLQKTYVGGVRALDNISFDVREGEFLVILGLSGSGKSTLLRCLNRLTDPTSGEIYFQGRRIDSVQGRELREVRRRLAMIFQHFNLIPRHSVLTNVLMGRLGVTPTLASIFNHFPEEARQEALLLLEQMGIAEKAAQRADQLSGGQQQRVAIARALMQKPKILLADEPVASLDPATCHTVMNHLRQINRDLGLTVVCNLHFLSLVREYATRVLALKDGEIVFQGSPKEIDSHWFKTIYGEDAREIQ
jgi:phosphonate transport system ATP-binding protein